MSTEVQELRGVDQLVYKTLKAFGPQSFEQVYRNARINQHLALVVLMRLKENGYVQANSTGRILKWKIKVQ